MFTEKNENYGYDEVELRDTITALEADFTALKNSITYAQGEEEAATIEEIQEVIDMMCGRIETMQDRVDLIEEEIAHIGVEKERFFEMADDADEIIHDLKARLNS